MEWTHAEEQIISRIMADETMHDPENDTGDIRIKCTRAEALRRLQRRKVYGEYQVPSKPWVVADINLPVTPRKKLTPEHLARLNAGRESKRLVGAF
jgi:hypothetical protein